MIIECRKCKEPKEVHCTEAQVEEWKKGALIQRVMPDVLPDERELLISGICGPCFDKLFPGADEDEDEDEYGGFPKDRE